MSTAPMMLEVPSPLPLGMAARVVSSIPPPKSLSIVAERPRAPAASPSLSRRKPAERQGGLGQAELALGLPVIERLVEFPDDDPDAVVDGVDPDLGLAGITRA